ncbi:MAG: oligosaccharide flippase family protein [Planctomycetaceae bacterium]|nr:oligosaccharide flippase family protein [Planctomycetaceae bacterium]
MERVQQSPIGKRIVSGTFWSVVGNGFGKVFTFIAMVLVARILGKEAFGEFGLVHSTAAMFVTFSSFGMGMTATKYIAEFLHSDKERAGRIIGLTYVFTFFTSFVVAIVFYLISPWICETCLKNPQLTNVMRLASGLLFMLTFMGTQTAVMTGFQDFRGLAIVAIIVGILSLPIYTVSTYWFGILGAVAAVIFCTGLNILINSMFIYRNTTKHQIRYLFSNTYKEISILWNSNLPLVISGILYVGMVWLVQMMLRIQPNGAAELGEFYAAQNIQIAFFFLPTLLSTVFFPNLCEVGGMSQNSRYWTVVKKGLGLQTVISLILALPMIMFPNFLMKLYGNEFIGNGLILVTFGIWGIVNILCITVWQVMIDQKKAWIFVFFELGEIIISLTITYFLLEKQWGNIGIVTSFITGRIFILILMIFYLRKYTQ